MAAAQENILLHHIITWSNWVQTVFNSFCDVAAERWICIKAAGNGLAPRSNPSRVLNPWQSTQNTRPTSLMTATMCWRGQVPTPTPPSWGAASGTITKRNTRMFLPNSGSVRVLSNLVHCKHQWHLSVTASELDESFMWGARRQKLSQVLQYKSHSGKCLQWVEVNLGAFRSSLQMSKTSVRLVVAQIRQPLCWIVILCTQQDAGFTLRPGSKCGIRSYVLSTVAVAGLTDNPEAQLRPELLCSSGCPWILARSGWDPSRRNIWWVFLSV